MDDITTEKKLQLVQQIRTQHHKNQYDLSNREQILYGKISAASYGEKSYEAESWNGSTAVETNASESLKIRSILAIMLFLFAILFDLCEIQPVGIRMQEVFDAIATDYQTSVTAFVDTIYTEHILQP